MPITYRLLKGAPLSAEELDQNFRELLARLEACEAQIKVLEAIHHPHAGQA